ncbi:MAG: hypothetical protein AAF317_18095 [Pseudomonadota bacterium]
MPGKVVASGLFIALVLAGSSGASISNRVAMKNERLERHEKLQRCAAFFQLIASFRDRRPNEGVRLNEVAGALSERSTEVLVDTQNLETDAANAETLAAVEGYLDDYRAVLTERFGPVQSATFETYDLLLMQEDLKFCNELASAEGLAPRRPLPAR